MKKRSLLTLLLTAAITILAIHVAFQLTEGLRADVTEDNLYSLTDGTLAILDKMDSESAQPLDLTLYFSLTNGKTLPRFIKQFIVYHDYVKHLLSEYERAGKGLITVRAVDPLTDSDEAQDALDYGLDGKPINQHGDLFFFGLVLETRTGSREVIEFLWPRDQENIEYEISKRIQSLLWPSSKKIGVLSSLELLGPSDPYMAQLMAAQGRRPPEPWIAMRLLQERYTVTQVDLDTAHISPLDYDLLVVIHPKSLPPKTQWALDEWVVTGGDTLVFVDPYAIDDRPPENPQQPWAAMQYEPSSSLGDLGSAWGVTRAPDLVAADLSLGMRRPVSRRGPAEKVIVDLFFNESNRSDVINADHPVTRGLGTLRLFMAGQLDLAPPDGVTVENLLTTTATGNTLTMKPGFGGGEDLVFTDVNSPARLMDRFVEGDEPVVLAAILQGRMPSAFPEGVSFPASTPERPAGLPPDVEMPPPEDAEMIHKDPVAEEDRRDARLIVVADVDIISDQVAFQQSLFGPSAANDNHVLLLNAVDYLLGAEELVSVRAKKSIARPFVLFDRIEEEADEQTRERERELRAEVEEFNKQVQEKQRELSQQNASLFEKRLQDEVDSLNERLGEANSELREIRKAKRAALASEEAFVRFTIMWLMPILVLVLGLVLWMRRNRRMTNRQEVAR
jgi:ABC-type uncharacterized transport system involved in gliding motility auxiliary subunit